MMVKALATPFKVAQLAAGNTFKLNGIVTHRSGNRYATAIKTAKPQRTAPQPREIKF